MTLSIRARLTMWYCSIVVAVLVTGMSVGSFIQFAFALQRLDDDIARSMATLEGVMRTEFGEGLSLEAAAQEASLEVVVPDRTVVLFRSDGSLLEVWGLPLERKALPRLAVSPTNQTIPSPAGEQRVMTRRVEYGGHAYGAAIMAPLADLRGQHTEMVRAMALGVAVALVVAAGGGWIIGRQTLSPLTRMAEQVQRVNERDPRERVTVPPVDDELGRLATSFNGLLARLGAAMNVQRQFMADASHELRTPISVVRTAAQVTLAKALRSSDEYRDSLRIIGEQAARLSRLVDAMFLLSRAEAQGVPLQTEFLNLDDLLAESVRAARVLAQQRAVRVVAGGDEEVGLIGDDGLLRRMIGNLLDNAIRHANPGGRVVATLELSDDHVRLRITNDGAGIDPADHARVFDRFVGIGTSKGAGLGLPIAKWVAEAHRGTLVLEISQPGRTTFVATLPLAPCADAVSTPRGNEVTGAQQRAPAR